MKLEIGLSCKCSVPIYHLPTSSVSATISVRNIMNRRLARLGQHSKMKILSIISFLWALLTITMVAIASFTIGHLPKYGLDNEPSNIFSEVLLFCYLIFSILFIFSIFIYLALRIIRAIPLRNFTLNKYDILISIGVFVFIILRIFLTSQYLWLND